MRYTRLVLICLFLFITVLAPARVSAQERLGEVKVDYTFGQELTFELTLRNSVEATSVQFYVQVEGDNNTRSAQAQLDDSGKYVAVFDLTEAPMRAFSDLTYWFEIVDEAGETRDQYSEVIYYEDNRFEWDERQDAPFRIHWYESGDDFAQGIIDVAQQGLEKVQGLLPLAAPAEIDIYAYANAQDMRDSIYLSTRNWVGAHADPDLGVMVVSLPSGPEQRLEMERQIPHELMHIMLYEQIGAAYADLPTWLIEGLASLSELYPNPDYIILLNGAYERESLIDMASLCNNFPRDASVAYLAYAESASFTRYLYRQFGSTGLDALVATYTTGVDCERGVELAYGSSLSQLERQWREDTFGEDPYATAAINLGPWIVILALALGIPLALSFFTARRKPLESR